MGSWWSQFKNPEPDKAIPTPPKAVTWPGVTQSSSQSSTWQSNWQNNYPTQVANQPVLAPVEPQAILANQGYLGKPPPSARESTTCPECGSANFFSRTLGVMRGPAPAPLCAECGYNGLFTQSGTLLNGAGVLSGGPTHLARSDNPGGDSRMDWSHPLHVPGRRT